MKPRPNILWIVMDAARADHLSCMGHSRKTTPNVDALAEEGLLFENAFSTSDWTPPSHASMLTGKLPCRHGVYDKTRFDQIRDKTVGERLPPEYESLFIDSMPHLRGIGADRGFKKRVSTTLDASPGQPLYWQSLMREVLGLDSWETFYKAETIKSFAGGALSRKKPFFVFANFDDAHFPYDPPRRFERFTAPGMDGDAMSKLAGRKSLLRNVAEKVTGRRKSGLRQTLSRKSKDLTSKEKEILKALYDSELLYLDNAIGKLVNFLKSRGIYDSTLIIITSDHGELFGEHGRVMHGRGKSHSLYSAVTRVPLVMRGPGVPRKRVAAMVSLADLAPTVCSLLGIGCGKRLDGVPLVPPRREYHEHVVSEAEGVKSIRTKTRHLIRSEEGVELYDVPKDPEERKDISKTEKRTAKSLLAHLSKKTKLGPRQSLRSKITRLKKSGRPGGS